MAYVGVGVEVTIAAPGQAESDVNVDPRAVLTASIAHSRHGDRPTSSRSTRSAAMKASYGTSTRPTRRIRRFPSLWRSSNFLFLVISPP